MTIKLRAMALVAYFCLINSSIASGNQGTLLPLDQYQAGTEQTNSTIVPNGDFETVAGGQPVGWLLQGQQGQFGVGAPLGANTGNNGALSARGVVTPYPAASYYERTIAVLPQTDYVLSAYLWAFEGSGAVSVLANDGMLGGTALQLTSGPRGVFIHSPFNSGVAAELIIVVGIGTEPPLPGGVSMMGGQIDNVAITPLSEFVPPVAIPEPIHLSLLSLTTTTLFHRPRRQRPAD